MDKVVSYLNETLFDSPFTNNDHSAVLKSHKQDIVAPALLELID